MKKLLLVLAVAGTAFYSSAQTLPKPSPKAEVEQVVGATEIELEYSRPGVKGRTIFGELVPFGKPWRLGANSATTLNTEHALFFDGKELKPGTYAVFAVPEKDAWKVMFNSDSKSSANDFEEAKNVLTVEAKLTENSFTETFYIGFDKIKDESASIVVLWDKTKAEIPFTVNTKQNALNNIKKAEKKGEDLESVYGNAANYFYGTEKDYKMALSYVEKSLNLGENFRNLFLKARIMNELGKKKEAKKLGERSLELAMKNGSKGYQNFIKGTLDRWAK